MRLGVIVIFAEEHHIGVVQALHQLGEVNIPARGRVDNANAGDADRRGDNGRAGRASSSDQHDCECAESGGVPDVLRASDHTWRETEGRDNGVALKIGRSNAYRNAFAPISIFVRAIASSDLLVITAMPAIIGETLCTETW